MYFYELLNGFDHTLEKQTGHEKNFVVDHFIDELRAHLEKMEVASYLKKFPSNTLFTLDRYEGNYAVCENRTTGEMVDIPRAMVELHAKESDILRREGQSFVVDKEATKAIREEIKKLLD